MLHKELYFGKNLVDQSCVQRGPPPKHILKSWEGKWSLVTPTSELVMFETSALFFFIIVAHVGGPSMVKKACSHKVRIFLHIAYIIDNVELCVEVDGKPAAGV